MIWTTELMLTLVLVACYGCGGATLSGCCSGVATSGTHGCMQITGGWMYTNYFTMRALTLNILLNRLYLI